MQLKLEDVGSQIYAFLDPASGKKMSGQAVKKTRARSAIIVAAVDSLYRIFVLHTWADQVSPSRIRDKVLEINGQFRPRVFGIESSAQQFLFADLVGAEARRLGQRLNLAAVDQPTNVFKDDRIRNTIEPLAQTGRLFIQEDQVELEQELRGFPTARTKDLVDALASCINLAPKPRPRKERDQEADELASYLRAQGMSASYIEQRIREIKKEESLLTI
jgi:hypothetical protein